MVQYCTSKSLFAIHKPMLKCMFGNTFFKMPSIDMKTYPGYTKMNTSNNNANHDNFTIKVYTDTKLFCFFSLH